VRKIAMDVRELDIDLIDRVNPFEAAYAVLSKAMDEKIFKQVKAVIEAKKVILSYEEARELALRALKFKQERGRVPEITTQDAWEKRLAEGIAALARYRSQAANG
jgi:cytochrome c5